MSQLRLSALLIGVALASATVVGSAQAADRRFCDGYARAAVNQFRAAVNNRRCRGAVRDDPARWSPDFRHHYDWCLGVDRRDANEQRDARRSTLDRCAG